MVDNDIKIELTLDQFRLLYRFKLLSETFTEYYSKDSQGLVKDQISEHMLNNLLDRVEQTLIQYKPYEK